MPRHLLRRILGYDNDALRNFPETEKGGEADGLLFGPAAAVWKAPSLVAE